MEVVRGRVVLVLLVWVVGGGDGGTDWYVVRAVRAVAEGNNANGLSHMGKREKLGVSVLSILSLVVQTEGWKNYKKHAKNIY